MDVTDPIANGYFLGCPTPTNFSLSRMGRTAWWSLDLWWRRNSGKTFHHKLFVVALLAGFTKVLAMLLFRVMEDSTIAMMVFPCVWGNDASAPVTIEFGRTFIGSLFGLFGLCASSFFWSMDMQLVGQVCLCEDQHQPENSYLHFCMQLLVLFTIYNAFYAGRYFS